jgi:hypothetical protein
MTFIQVVVIVVRDGRSGVNNRLIWIAGIQFIAPLFFKDFDIVNPVVIQSWYHQFGRQFQQVPIGNNIFQGLILKRETGIECALLAPFHDFLGVLINEFHSAVFLPIRCN